MDFAAPGHRLARQHPFMGRGQQQLCYSRKGARTLDQHVIVYREFLQAVMSFWTSLACPTKEYFEELLAIGCTIENGMMRCAAQYPTIRAQTFG